VTTTNNEFKPEVISVIHDEIDNFLERWGVCEPVKEFWEAAKLARAPWQHIILPLPERVVMVMIGQLEGCPGLYGVSVRYVEAVGEEQQAIAKQALKKALLQWRRRHGLMPVRKLSCRPKRRAVTFQCELNGYGNGTGQRYAVWCGPIAKG
jgi:hypothetical protein